MAAYLMMQDIQRRALRRERVFRDRTAILEKYTDDDLISRYRFPRRIILEIASEVDDIVSRSTLRTQAIPANTQVLITLRYLAKADFFSEIADIHGVSKSSVSRIIHSVCSAINARRDNIKFPTDVDSLRRLKEEFYKLSNFPNVIGAIDGTLIPIQGISGNVEPAFICRKGFPAINVQAIVDADMKYLNINAKYPGATHDANILANSNVTNIMENEINTAWLLGDSGYALKDWLLTPFLNPTSRKEEAYNRAHCRTRAVIERSFGVLKSRFRCLHQTGGCLPFSPLKCSRIIETCFPLHNIAIDEKVPLRQGGHVINMHQNIVFQGQIPLSAQQKRLQVANKF